jgi:hypothetical protein
VIKKGGFMKRALTILFLLTFIACTPQPGGQGTTTGGAPGLSGQDEYIDGVNEYVSTVETRLPTYSLENIVFLNARDQIKQKWSGMEVYRSEGTIIKIRLIPYSEISMRTEEFFFRDRELIYAKINDNGLADNIHDKGFWFAEDRVIKMENTRGKTLGGNPLTYEAKLSDEAREFWTLASGEGRVRAD